MNPIPLLLGAAAVAGLFVARRGGTSAVMFLAAGVLMSVGAAVFLIVRNPAAVFFAGIVAVPYWAAWLFVYTVRGASPRDRLPAS